MTSASAKTTRSPSDRAGNGRLDAAADVIDQWFDLWVGWVNMQRRMAISTLGLLTPLYSAVDEASQVARGATDAR